MRKETGMQTDPRKGEERFTAGPGTHTLPLTPINQLTEGDRTEKAQSLCFHPLPVVPSLRMAPLLPHKITEILRKTNPPMYPGRGVDSSEQHILQKSDLWWKTGHRTQELRTQAPSHPPTSPQLMKEVQVQPVSDCPPERQSTHSRNPAE